MIKALIWHSERAAGSLVSFWSLKAWGLRFKAFRSLGGRLKGLFRVFTALGA